MKAAASRARMMQVVGSHHLAQKEGLVGVAQDALDASNILQQFREFDPKQVVPVSLTKVLDNPQNARRIYPQDRIAELAESIAEQGQMSPAHAFPLKDKPGYWQLVDGHFRKQALLRNQAETIDLLPVTPCDAFEMYHLSYLLNHERSAQTAYDNAMAWKELLDKGIVDGQEALAARLKVSAPKVSRTLALLDLPEDALQVVRAYPEAIKSSMGYALFLYWKSTQSVEKLKDLLQGVIDKRITGTREVDQLRTQAERASGPVRREHSTSYPLRLPDGVKARFREFEKQGKLSLEISNLPETQRVELREKLLKLFAT